MTERTVLLVLSERDDPRLLAKRILCEGVKKVFLCPVEYLANKLPSRIQEACSLESMVQFELVDFVEAFNRTSFALKDEYIAFIHAISEKKLSPGNTVKEYFSYPGKPFSLWWLSLIAEKNQFKSQSFTLFSKAITIARLQRSLGCHEIWCGKHAGVLNELLCLSRKQAGLWEGLKIIAIEQLRVLRFACCLFKKMIDIRNFRRDFSVRKTKLREHGFALLTNFPDIDGKALQEGKFVNLTYGSIQKAIEENGRHDIAWFGIYGTINSSTWKQAIKIASSVKQAALFFMLEEWLTFSSFLSIIMTYIRSAVRCLPILKHCRRLFEHYDPVSGRTFDFWSIHKKDFISSFSGKVLFWNITYYTIFANIAKALHGGTKVLYFAEMHGWEKALNIACSKRADITTVGLQHGSVPILLLNYFEHPEDLKGDDYLKYMPTPKYLGCLSPLTMNLFLRGEWKKEKLFVLGGFRFGGLKNNGNVSPRYSMRKNQIIVPFSISSIGSREMLLLLYEAFNDKDLNFTVLLKTHPCYSMEKVIKKLGLKLNDKVFKFTNESLSIVTGESKLMIVKESSSVFWAIYHKTPVIIPRFYGIVDLCPLSGISDLGIYVNNPDELFKATLRAMEEEHAVSGEKYQEFLNSYLEIHEKDAQYYDNLIRAVHN